MSCQLHAYAAARAALFGRAKVTPKDATVAAICALHNGTHSAIKARPAALNQIDDLLISAPEAIRAKYDHLRGTARPTP